MSDPTQPLTENAPPTPPPLPDAESVAAPAASPPRVETPKPTRRAGFDPELERQLNEAMAGMDAKAVYDQPKTRGPKKHHHGGDGRKKGRVVALHADDVFVDVGGRSQGVLPLAQFDAPPKIGDEVDVHIEGYDNANGLLLLTRQGAAQQVDWSIVAEGMIVEARVTGVNKGGLSVEVNGLRGFLPASHVELFRVEDFAPYVNQKLRCLVTDVNPAEKNLVVSRRALLEKEREEAREKLWAELKEGQIRTGTVRTVKEFGAFVDLGGADGLLHVSEMAWSRVEDASTLVQPGQQIQVVILKIDQEKRKLSLGLKQLQESPWSKITEKYVPDSTVPGKVTKIMDFGAFVELEPGIEGLVHVSELSHQHVRRVLDVVKPGQEVQVRILKVEPSQRRISLSMKPHKAEAEPVHVAEAEPERPRKAPPPRKSPLKGGLGR